MTWEYMDAIFLEISLESWSITINQKSRGREEKYIAGLFNESLRFSKSVNSFSFLLQSMRNEKNTGERETDVQL